MTAPRKITVADTVGFCSGVQRALKIARKAAAQYKKVAVLGAIVHNEVVVKELAEQGVEVFSDLAAVPDDLPIIFRSHGTPIQVWAEAQKRGLHIIDATCPLVKKIHKEVQKLAAEGRQIVIIGDHNHEEVEAIASQVGQPLIVADTQEAENLSFFPAVGVVIQSTQDLANVQAIVAVLLTKTDDLHLINTICKPTRERQEQIRRLASENDVVIVIGSKRSANTKRLTMLAKEINPRTYQVASEDELQTVWFDQVRTVAVASGASTPSEMVAAIVKKISEIP